MSNWPTKKLGEVLEKNGVVPAKIKRDDYRPSGKYPVVDQGENLIAGYIDDKQKLYRGDLPVIIFGDHTRILKYIDFPFAFGADGIKILRPQTILLPKFFYYVLVFNPVENQGYKRHFSILTQTKIPLPPLEIQRQIVERMDKIAEAQKLNDKLIQKADELFESILHNEVKSAGKEVLFTEATDFQEGPGILAKDFRNSGIPLVRLKGTTGPEVTLEGCNFLDPHMVKQKWHHFLLKRGDLLLTTSASLGQVSEVTDVAEGTITYTGIIRFRPNGNLLDKGYLKYFLSSELFKSQARKAATGGVIKHFGPIHLRKMKIFLPPKSEQQKIVAKLSAVQEYKKQLLAQKSKLRELFNSVLDKSMRGEID